jgi:hypothetical protein
MRSTILLLLALTVSAFGQAFPGTAAYQAAFLKPAAGGGATYLVNQNFEGTGYDNGETWAESGTANEDYGTPLKGSQSLHVSGSFSGSSTDFANQTTAYAHCRFLLGLIPSGQDGFFILADKDNGNAYRAAIYINASRQVFLYANGGVGSASGSTVQANETYYVWLDYVASGQCVVAMSKTSTRPTVDGSTDGGDIYLTGTGGTGNANRIFAYNATDATMVYDNVLVDDAAIGNNPNP